MKRYIAIIVLLILLLLCGILILNMKRDMNIQTDAFNAMQDELHITKNKLGQETATVSVLQVSNKQLKQVNDSMYNRIKDVEKHYKKKLLVITTFDIHTRDTVSGRTEITKSDTIRKDSIITIYPEYKANLEYKNSKGEVFAKYNITMNKDSTHLISDIKNSIDVDFRYKKKNFFDRKFLVVDVKNYNPNTGVEQMKSYSPPAPKKTKFELILGIIVGAGGMLLLHH